MKMKTYANTGRMKKAGPTLTPDGKTLFSAGRWCGKSCPNRENSRTFCRNSRHADEYREIAELLRELRSEQLRRDMDSLLIGPGRSELMAFAFGLTKNHSEAEEMVQAACCRAFRYASVYDARKPLLRWLKVILRNVFRDGKRHSRLNISLELQTGDGFTLGDSLMDLGAPVEVRMERDRGTAALSQAMAELPKEVRRPVSLRDLEGMTYEAVAARLRVPLGTVRSRIWRGRRLLRDRVDLLTNSVNGGVYERAFQPV
jgi:RNA polymerase sigma-70 factor (ECF subfamily)